MCRRRRYAPVGVWIVIETRTWRLSLYILIVIDPPRGISSGTARAAFEGTKKCASLSSPYAKSLTRRNRHHAQSERDDSQWTRSFGPCTPLLGSGIEWDSHLHVEFASKTNNIRCYISQTVPIVRGQKSHIPRRRVPYKPPSRNPCLHPIAMLVPYTRRSVLHQSDSHGTSRGVQRWEGCAPTCDREPSHGDCNNSTYGIVRKHFNVYIVRRPHRTLWLQYNDLSRCTQRKRSFLSDLFASNPSYHSITSTNLRYSNPSLPKRQAESILNVSRKILNVYVIVVIYSVLP